MRFSPVQLAELGRIRFVAVFPAPRYELSVLEVAEVPPAFVLESPSLTMSMHKHCSATTVNF